MKHAPNTKVAASTTMQKFSFHFRHFMFVDVYACLFFHHRDVHQYLHKHRALRLRQFFLIFSEWLPATTTSATTTARNIKNIKSLKLFHKKITPHEFISFRVWSIS